MVFFFFRPRRAQSREFLQVGLSLNEVYELLYAKSGHYRDFEFAELDDGNAVVETDSKHRIREFMLK